MRDNFVDSMSGYEFEKYCVKLLQRAGFYNIQQTKLSGDFGIDVIAERNGKKIGIQCKRYSNPVGVQAVQEAVSGSVYYQCDFPMVLSNQDFTPQAMEMAHRTSTLLIKIDDLIKISESPDNPPINVLIPSTQDIVMLGMNMTRAFQNNGITITILEYQIGNNETVYFVQKESNVRLNKVASVKSEVMFDIGKQFEMTVDYEKQRLLFIFSNRDVVGYWNSIERQAIKNNKEKDNINS